MHCADDGRCSVASRLNNDGFKFSEQQIAYTLREEESGRQVADSIRMAICRATLCIWKMSRRRSARRFTEILHR
jgi:hypothetical protein